MSKKTGRRKEEGGHKRINISVDDFTKKALEKIRNGDGNVSKFIEKQLRPILENLDPGEASIHVWRIEAYLNQEIIKAAKHDKPEIVQALASITTALKDFRALCSIPPLEFQDKEIRNVRSRIQLRRNEPWILTFLSVAIVSIFGFIAIRDLSSQALAITANQTSPESVHIMRFMIQISPYLMLVPLLAVILVSALKARNWLRTKHNLLSLTSTQS